MSGKCSHAPRPGANFSLVTGRVVASSRGLGPEVTQESSETIPHSRLIALVERPAGRAYAVDVSHIDLKVGLERKVRGVLDLRFREPAFIYLENLEVRAVYAPEIGTGRPELGGAVTVASGIGGAFAFAVLRIISQGTLSTLWTSAMAGGVIGAALHFTFRLFKLRAFKTANAAFIQEVLKGAREEGLLLMAKNPYYGPLMRGRLRKKRVD